MTPRIGNGLQTGSPARTNGNRPLNAAPGFGQVLREQLARTGAPAAPAATPAEAGLKFSAHAQARLQEAQRNLSEGELRRLDEAVRLAESKGARESLILMPDLALVVSVQNRTVITAVGQARMRENVFTQIDSAVVL